MTGAFGDPAPMATQARLVDRFEVGPIIGRGGMGTVHRGLDRETAATVAIKFVRMDDPDIASRFDREAAVLARLDHPHIVRHVAHGRADDGRGFLVMEWLEGRTLEDVLHDGALSLRDAVRVTAQLCHAVTSTHAEGLVHRDIKPANLLLIGADGRTVRLIDFGIARGVEDRHLTHTGLVMGTPGYIAPEQIRGASQVDARADLYAVGVLLFRCIAGRMPFEDATTLSLLTRVVSECAPRLSRFAPQTPEALDALVASLLETEPDARPVSARAVARALDALLDELGADADAVVLTGVDLGGAEQRIRAHIYISDDLTTDAHTTTPSGTDETDALELLFPGSSPNPALERERRLAECALRFGGELEVRTGGARVVTLRDVGNASDEVRRAVCCAEALRKAVERIAVTVRVVRVAGGRTSGATIVNAAGGATDTARTVPVTSPIALELDRIRLDETAAGFLEGRFSVHRDAIGPYLVDVVPVAAPSRRILGRALPFLGRERELALLRSFYEETLEAQMPRVVVVTGPPGQGKSRLLQAALARIGESHTPPLVWTGHADQLDAGAPFSMWARVVVDAEQAGDPGALAPTLREGCEQRVVACALRQSDAQPLVIVIDDLHWADPPSVRAVDMAVRSLSGRPVLVMAFARPELDDAFPRLWAARSPQRIVLADLGVRAASQLVRAALGPSVTDTRVARLVERAAGNAFVLEELIRAAAEGRDDALPETVLALVQARLLTLEPEARRLLRLASLFGERFTDAGLLSVSGEGDAALDVQTWLRVLVERELVRSESAAGHGEAQWRFSHALVRDAAYELFAPEDRAQAHRQVLSALSLVARPDPLRLAHHAQRGERALEAARWWALAAENALRASDPASARKHAEAALACAGDGLEPAIEGGLNASAGEAARLLGDANAARTYFARAMERLPPGTPAWYHAQRNSVLMGMTFMYAPKKS